MTNSNRSTQSHSYKVNNSVYAHWLIQCTINIFLISYLPGNVMMLIFQCRLTASSHVMTSNINIFRWWLQLWMYPQQLSDWHSCYHSTCDIAWKGFCRNWSIKMCKNFSAMAPVDTFMDSIVLYMDRNILHLHLDMLFELWMAMLTVMYILLSMGRLKVIVLQSSYGVTLAMCSKYYAWSLCIL